MPIMNVFRRDGSVIRHFWGSELLYVSAPTQGKSTAISIPLHIPSGTCLTLPRRGAATFNPSSPTRPEPTMTEQAGGCLCGDVRLRLVGAPRMRWTIAIATPAAKHTGAPVSVFADCKRGVVEFTKGAPTLYESFAWCATRVLRSLRVDPYLRDGCSSWRSACSHWRTGQAGGLSAAREAHVPR